MGSFLERDGYCLRPVSEWQVDLCQNESDNACFAWFVCCMCGGPVFSFLSLERGERALAFPHINDKRQRLCV